MTMNFGGCLRKSDCQVCVITHHPASISERSTVIFVECPQRPQGSPLSVSGQLLCLMFLPMGMPAGQPLHSSMALLMPTGNYFSWKAVSYNHTLC